MNREEIVIFIRGNQNFSCLWSNPVYNLLVKPNSCGALRIGVFEECFQGAELAASYFRCKRPENTQNRETCRFAPHPAALGVRPKRELGNSGDVPSGHVLLPKCRGIGDG